MSSFFRLAVLLSMTVMLSACLSLGPDSKPVTLFRLDPVVSEARVEQPTPLKLSISSGSLLNSQRLWVYQGDGKVAGFAEARWAMPLPEMFRQTLISSLEQSGTAIVLESPAQVGTLRVAIRDFQVDNAAGAAQAVVAIKATWIDLDGENIQHRLIRASESANLSSAESVAGAMNSANQSVLKELRQWLLQAVESASETNADSGQRQ